jgi:hypothetical protein
MSNAKSSWFKWSMIAVTLVALAAFCVPAFAQAPAVTVGDTQITGRINDWTMHHVVFPNPGTEREAMQSGHYDEWLKIVNDPRYVMQQLKRNAPVQGPAASFRGPFPIAPRNPFGPQGIEPASAIKKDWSMESGLQQPVSLIFTVNSAPSGSTVSASSTFTIDGQTLTGSAPVKASETGTFSGNPTTGQTVTIGGTEILTASDSTPATGSGTFSGNPTTGQTVTVNGIALTASDDTQSTATGTFTGNPSNGQTTTVNGTALTASLSVQATQTGTFTGNPATGQTVTVNGVVLTASDSTAATGSGTFTGNPTTGQTVSVSGTALTASDSTLSTASGTFTGNPTDGQTTTVNGITLTASVSVQASRVGTFTAEPASNGTVTVGTTVLTIGAPSTTTITIHSTPTAGNTVGGGSYTYQFETTNTSCTSGERCVQISGTTLTAANLAAAIAGTTCFNTGGCPGPGASDAKFVESYTSGSSSVTITNATSGSITLTTSSTTHIYLNGVSQSSYTFAAPSGTNGCTTAIAGTFQNPDNTTALATVLAQAINACHTTFGIGVTATSSTNTVTATAVTGGSAGNNIATTSTATGFSWAGTTLAGGTDGTNTGTDFVVDFVPTDNATNLAAAILRNVPTVTEGSSGGVVSLAATTYGSAGTIGTSNTLSSFNWSVVAGIDGTNTGTSFRVDFVSLNDNATNLAAAINRNVAAVTATPSGAGVTVTDNTWGLAGNAIALASTATGYSWTHTTLTGGADGANTGTSFAIVNVNATNATNLAAAITRSVTGVTAASGGTATVTVTASTGGPAGNSIGTTSGATGFSWGNTTLLGGTNGTNTGTYFAVDNVVADNATNLAAAITRNVASVTDTSSAGAVSLTANTYGTASTITTSNSLSNFSWSIVAGTNGTNTGTSFRVDFVLADDATNLATAITGTTTTGATATASGATVNVSAATWGSAGDTIALGGTATPTNFSWAASTLAGGTDGTNTGTDFAIVNSNTTDAANLSAAIARNGGTVGVTSTSSAAVVTVTAAKAGTGGNSITLTGSPTGFAWAGSGTLAGGSDGTTSGTLFKYWATSTYDSEAQLAADLTAALKTNSTVNGAFTITNTSNSVTITDKTAGTGDYSQFATVANMTALNFLGEVNLTGGVAPNSYPALYSSALGTNFDTGVESCSDFVVYPTGVLGSGSQATVIAYTGLYLSGNCSSAGGPAVSWAYNTGGVSTLSPTPSLDGTQVAYIQTTGGVASLVILTPEVNQGGSFGVPSAPTLVSNGSYRGCTAPCYTTIPFSNSANDTNSSPFYDYASATADTLWVGDDNGYLHEFTGVFLGTPAENTTNWPVTVDAGYKLTGAVYDPTSTFVFVGDSNGVLSSVSTAGAPVLNQTAALAGTGSLGIADAPIVDEVTGGPKVYAFVGYDTTTSCGGPCARAYQFNTDFTGKASVSVTASPFGGDTGGAATLPIFAGAFDNLHYDIAGGTGGNLYVCGIYNTTILFHLTGSELFQIPMSGTFGATTHTETLGTATELCSPVTEFLASKAGSANTTLTDAIGTGAVTVTVGSTTGFAAGDYVQIDSEIMLVATPMTATTFTVAAVGRGEFGTADVAHSTTGVSVQDIQDYLYVSIPAGGLGSICTGACLANFLVTTGSTTLPGTTATITEAGGTTGIVVDNYLTGTDESNIYFSTLKNQGCTGNGTSGSGPGICAVQASQSAP